MRELREVVRDLRFYPLLELIEEGAKVNRHGVRSVASEVKSVQRRLCVVASDTKYVDVGFARIVVVSACMAMGELGGKYDHVQQAYHSKVHVNFASPGFFYALSCTV